MGLNSVCTQLVTAWGGGDAKRSSNTNKSSFFCCCGFCLCVCVCGCNEVLFRSIKVSVMIQVFPVSARCANTQQRKELCLKLSKLSARWNTRVGWKEDREEQKETVNLVALLSENCCCLQSWILALERLLLEWDEKWPSLSKDFDGKGNSQDELPCPESQSIGCLYCWQEYKPFTAKLAVDGT